MQASNLPCRIQRKRTAGWVQPDNTRYAGRPTQFGNPFDWKEVGRERAAEMYDQWLDGQLDHRFPDLTERRVRILQKISDLKGKTLSCWCQEGEPCHGDVLLRRANAD